MLIPGATKMGTLHGNVLMAVARPRIGVEEKLKK